MPRPLSATYLGGVRVIAGNLAFKHPDHHRLANPEATSSANATALTAFGSTQLISDRVQGTASQLLDAAKTALDDPSPSLGLGPKASTGPTLSGQSIYGPQWLAAGRRIATLEPMNAVPDSMRAFPGCDLIERGIADLSAGEETTEALLVSIGAGRLRSVGIGLPSPIESPEHKLYLHLMRETGDAAHSAYNALIRRLVSFERTAQCAT